MTATLLSEHDALLLDLDGVVYAGTTALPHAVESLGQARMAGINLAFVTNNASRTPAQVAGMLTGMGVPAEPRDVVTSAQAAARVLAELLAPGALVLVVGGEGLLEAVRERGFVVVNSAADHPQAVVQGFSPDVGWRQLAEATFALRAGALYVASNTDLTIPTAHGIGPGNGLLVHAVRTASGVAPVVAGKPETPLMAESVERVAAARPLVVGDRLDTDIAGANRAGIPSLLVLTGVTDVGGLLAAQGEERPTYVGRDLRALLRPGVPVGSSVVESAPPLVEPASSPDKGSSQAEGGWLADVARTATEFWAAADAGMTPGTEALESAAARLESSRPADST